MVALARDRAAQAAPENAKASFDECLHLVACAHAQEIGQLRAENALLRKQVASTPSPPGTPRSGGASIVAIEDLPTLEEEAPGSQALNGLGAVASKPSSMPGAVDAGTARCQESGRCAGPSLYSCHSQKSQKFPLMSQWTEKVDSPLRRTQRRPDITRMTVVNRLSRLSQLIAGVNTGRLGGDSSTDWRSRLIAYPSCRGRLLWDVLGAALIIYDLVAIPLDAFSPPRTSFVRFMDWFTLVYWTINMPLSLQVGFVLSGKTIMDFHKICVNYLRTWFIMDLIVVVPDWAFTLASLSYDPTRSKEDSFRLLRTLRLIRMTRLLRLLKLGRILRRLGDLIETEHTSILANIGKMLVVILVISHYVGCIWYLISVSGEGNDTWVVYHHMDQATWAYAYLTSFHWALTQFTPSSMHVQPQNIAERTFAIFVVVNALVGFSYVVGSITGSLTQLRALQEDSHKQFWQMRRCLKQNRVPPELSGRITRYLEHAWRSQRETVNPRDYKIFSLLSEQLQSELHCEIWMPCLRVHALFAELSDVSSMTMRRIAMTAMQRKPLAQGDHVFQLEKAMYMYILVRGCMQYTKIDSEHEETPVLVSSQGVILAEPVLWTPIWNHLGVLIATSETEVLALDPQKFVDIMRRSMDAFPAAIHYGRSYIAMLNDLEEQDLSDIIQFEKSVSTLHARSSKLPAIWG